MPEENEKRLRKLRSLFCYKGARGETRTHKVFLPTASETATFANFATRAVLNTNYFQRSVPRTRVELVRLPATPSKWCVCQFRHLGKGCKSKNIFRPAESNSTLLGALLPAKAIA